MTYSTIDTDAPTYPALAFSIAMGALSTWIFLSLGHVATDNLGHAIITVGIWNGEADWPPNFLYYALLGTIGNAIGDGEDLILTSCLLLGLAVGAKTYLTLLLLRHLAPGAGFALAAAAVAVVLFTFPLPIAWLNSKTLSYYIGNIPPNVWHNSTTIFLMPFAIAAFALQALDFEERTTRRAPVLMILIVVGVVIKPSFFFAYAPATGLWLLARYRDGFGRMVLGGLPILAGAAVTLALYVAIFHFQQGSIQQGESGVTLSPFAVWIDFVTLNEIPLAIFASFSPVIVYAVLGLRPARPVWLVYAALLVVFAMLIFVLVAETGPRREHGNFGWQTIVTSYLLHAVIAGDLLDKWSKGVDRAKVLICALFYVAMAVSGVAYLYRMIALGVELPY